MKTFYVLWDGSHYLCSDPFSSEPRIHSYTENLGEAMRFESLCQALEFNESSGLQLEVLRVDITSAWTPDLAIPAFPGTDELVPKLDDPRWVEPNMELSGCECYGVVPGNAVGRGVLIHHPAGYFYIIQGDGFEFGVSKVIEIR